jgi:hypothetical protein
VVAHHTDDEIMGFLRSMLHEMRQKRRDMITHHTIDDLKKPLGFAKGQPGEGAQAPDRGPNPGEVEASDAPRTDKDSPGEGL